MWNTHGCETTVKTKGKKKSFQQALYIDTSLYTESLEYSARLLLAHFYFFMNGHNAWLPKGRIWSDHLLDRKHSSYGLCKRKILGFSYASLKANLRMVNYSWARCHPRPSNKPQTVKFSCLWTYILTYRIRINYKAQTKKSSLPESQRERKRLYTSLKHLFTGASSRVNRWLLE